MTTAPLNPSATSSEIPSKPPRLAFEISTGLEMLEDRMAPAVINAGPAAFGGVEYDTPGGAFSLASDAAVEAGDPAIFAPTDTAHFFIDLQKGDTLRIYNPSSAFTDFATVTSGRAFAFFFDSNGDSIPQANELTGLALAAGTNMTVNGSVDGDILTILDAKTGVMSTNGFASTSQTISSLRVSGDVNGSIIAAGSISSVQVGRLEQLRSGLVGAYGFDFGGTGASPGVGEGTLAAFQPAARGAGGSLSNITVGAADVIAAGNGGSGGAGGGITNVTVIADSNGLDIFAGTGGDGSGSLLNGGVGGKVSQIVIHGTADLTANNAILIFGGSGGDAVPASKGKGGVGGIVEKVWVGFERNSANQIVPSPQVLLDEVFVSGGNGGDGVTAGNGGSLVGINVQAAPPEDGGSFELSLRGGDAGALFAAGTKAGAGGNVSNFKISNLNFTLAPDCSDTFVGGGNASAWDEAAPVAGSGAAVGSITNPVAKAGETWLIGQGFVFAGGWGSDTDKGGGAGGSVSNLLFNSFSNIFLKNLVIDAGAGGDAGKGSGGRGGLVTGLSAPLATLETFAINQTAGSGDGGQSLTGGAGGIGGSISNVQIFDADAGAGLSALVTAGSGGDGFRSGAAGGAISTFSLFSERATLSAMAGNGGNATGPSGNGGPGGSVSGLSFASEEGTILSEVDVAAGNGGNATGSGGGGNGGNVFTANIQNIGSVDVSAGDGGASGGDKGKIGNGGGMGSSTTASAVFVRSALGDVVLEGGDAGGVLSGTPSKGGDGGSLTSVIASAFRDLTILGGDGSPGGNGGELRSIGFYGAEGPGTNLTGDIAIQAGNGGAALVAGGTAGRGGSLSSLTGAVSTVDVGLYTSSAVDGMGNVHVSYYDETNGDLKYALYNGTTWAVTTVDSLGDVGQYTSIGVTSANRPMISYYDATNGDLKFAQFDGVNWNISTVESSRNVGQYSSLALDASDVPAIAYYDATLGNLQFALYDGVGWDITTVASTGDVGAYSALAFDSTLNVYHVVYAEFGFGSDLEYRQSTDGGTTWSEGSYLPLDGGLFNAIKTGPGGEVFVGTVMTSGALLSYELGTDGALVDTDILQSSGANNPQQSLSMGVLPSGDPVLSYGVFGTSSQLALSTNTLGSWTTELIVQKPGTGGFSSLAVTGGGVIHVAYHDAAEASLGAITQFTPSNLGDPVLVDNPSDSLSVSFLAGNAGNGAGKGTAGGAVSALTILSGASDISVVAGTGGDGVSSGGVGGSVSGLVVGSTLVTKVVAAGDGGDANSGKAGNGGSISNVNVLADIGYRAGKSYGFATDGSLMGGIFAGLAGTNLADPANAKTAGLAGNVTGITAAAISSIVAGTGSSPGLVNVVDAVFLRGNTAVQADLTGAFENFRSANFVGGKAGNPTLAGATAFHFSPAGTFGPSDTGSSPWTLGVTQPLDGLIAATTLTANRNFTPLAFLTNTAAAGQTPNYQLFVPTVATA